MSGISLPDCDAKLVMIILPCNSRVIFFWGFFLGGGFGTPGGVGGMGAGNWEFRHAWGVETPRADVSTCQRFGRGYERGVGLVGVSGVGGRRWLGWWVGLGRVGIGVVGGVG